MKKGGKKISVLLSGNEAKKVFEDAQKLLGKIISEGLLKANGVVGLFPAEADEDDILVFDAERREIIGTLYGLRQQV